MTPEPEEAAAKDVKPKGLKYSRITADEQAQLLEARLRNLEAEHFSHKSNLGIAEATDNEEAAVQTRAAMVAIEAAYAQVAKQLKELVG